MLHVDENLIQVLKYRTLGDLPDLFAMEDGTKVTNPVQWEARRK